MSKAKTYTTRQAAEYLGVKQIALYQAARRGAGPARHKLPSGTYRYKRADLDAWRSVRVFVPSVDEYDTGAAAGYLNVHPGHLPRLRSEGKGPKFFKRGARVFYRRADLDAWNASRIARASAKLARLEQNAAKMTAKANRLKQSGGIALV